MAEHSNEHGHEPPLSPDDVDGLISELKDPETSNERLDEIKDLSERRASGEPAPHEWRDLSNLTDAQLRLMMVSPNVDQILQHKAMRILIGRNDAQKPLPTEEQ